MCCVGLGRVLEGRSGEFAVQLEMKAAKDVFSLEKENGPDTSKDNTNETCLSLTK